MRPNGGRSSPPRRSLLGPQRPREVIDENTAVRGAQYLVWMDQWISVPGM
jgi:hypothetical protein